MNARTDTANERIGQQAVDLALARKQRGALLDALRDVIDELRAIKDLEVTVSAATAIMRASIAIEKAGK